MSKEEVKELEKKYRELEIKYRTDKYAVIDEKKIELEELKDEYIINRLAIEEPLKAEKYRLKVEKKKEHRK